jgi:hypothetical protein
LRINTHGWTWIGTAQFAPVLIAIIFNAITLLPELRVAIPSLNDDAFHYLYVNRAEAAISTGENPVDNWAPVLELGFPQFFYYQHVPYIAVALLYRACFERIRLITLFNLVRYLLLVGLPLTVWWSMRIMGFSPIAAAVGAAFSPLISSNDLFGFEYNSYIWRGYGMYAQLWAMHFFFIATACLHRALSQRTGYGLAIFACTMVVLSDLMYAYMLGVTAAVLLVFNLRRSFAR